MEILEKLKEQGWHLTEDGLKKLPDNSDPKKIISAALDFDFREIAGGALPPELSKKDDSFHGRIVLQVQKIRNISAPKANEESKVAPRFLQVEFSDGVTLMQALELEPISILSLNTPPGTKVYFKCEKIPLMQGMIIMRAMDIQLLGGKVTALVEKWEMTRSLQKYAKSGRIQSGSSGPPPWIAFGQKLQSTITADKNFKSLAQTEKEKDAKENDEFNAMRSEAIAEAAKIGAKKIFGGGNHQILDHNVKKILEKGYSEEEAKNALRATGNSLERALYNLKRRGDDFKNREDFKERSKTLPMGGKRGSKELGKRGKEVEVAAAAKPAGNVSLFDFLTDKLPANAESSTAMTQSTTTSAAPTFSAQNSKYESYSRPMTKAGSEPSTKPFYNSSSNSNSSHGYQERRQNQDSSSSGKSQDQNPNRPKFENNLSSSFATRNSSHPGEERYNRYSNSNRGRGGGNPFHGRPNQPYEENSDRHREPRGSGAYSSTRGGRGGHDRGSGNNNYNSAGGGGSSSGGGYDNRRYNDGQHRQERQEHQQSQRNGYEQKPVNGKGAGASTSRYQQQKESSNTYHQNSSSSSGRNYDNSRQSNYNSSAAATNNNANQTSSSSGNNANNNNNNDHSARMTKLVESTTKMKIDKTRSGPSPRNQQQYQQQSFATQQQPPQPLLPPAAAQQQQTQQQPSKPNQQQQPPQQMSSTTTQKLQQTFGTLPNGINYDPSKIIGFQSKETNEFALNLLKSQGIPTGLPSHGGGSQGRPPPASQPQFVSGPPPPQPQQGPPPPNMQMGPQPFATGAFMVPQAGPPPTYSPSAFGMIPGENWNWKIGDQCLAKYWDDGRYYEAEITGISDKTCVVLFLGYGNHEEVLKTDCLPITDAHHRPINFTTNMQQAPPVTSVAPQSMLSRGVPNRYRGERQMYVPPPKRDN